MYFISGKITFSTTSIIKIYVNLPMENIISLIQKLENKIVQIQTNESANGNNITIDKAIFQNMMIVLELLDSDWSRDIEIIPLHILPTF